jgi:formate C-acetyltransferase
MRLGGGILAVYNEDLVIESMTDYGYELREARQFANDGCWEVQVPGKTYFSYWPFDSLNLFQKETMKSYSEQLDYPDFESLYNKYIDDLRKFLECYMLDGKLKEFERDDENPKKWRWKKNIPCTVVSLFEGDCIERGLSYLEGGAVYNVVSPHIGGLADTANSLYAIKKAVYDEKKLTLNELCAVLKTNWEGAEPLRQYFATHYAYFGNDDDEADEMCARLLGDFADICKRMDNRCGYCFPAGVSTFGRQLQWAPTRMASPHGKRGHEILAANCSPTPGTDKAGATAIIRSYCKLPLKKTVTGAALDLKLLPSSVQGEDGIEALVALLRGFTALGGFFMQPDVVNADVLKDAQKNPEEYQTLSVRVSGWNARFVTLDEEWQNMIIEQNEK